MNIFLHELSLHDDHPPEDFRPPFRLDSRIGSNGSIKMHAPQYINSITICILSAQALLDIFLGADIETLRAFPVFNYVRMIYATLVLIKLHASASSDSSSIGGAIDIQSLKLDLYLDKLIDLLMLAVGSVEFRSAFTFGSALIRLRTWYKEQKTRPDTASQPKSLFGPEDSMIPKSASTGNRNDSSTPPKSGIDVLRMPDGGFPGIGRDSGPGFLTEQYETQMDLTNDSQFFNSNMGIDDDAMTIFNDMGRSFDGDLSAWDPSMVVPGDISGFQMSDMDAWNVSQQDHV